MKIRNIFQRHLTLKQKMNRVNWCLQTIAAHAGSLSVLMNYKGELPVVDPFEFIVKNTTFFWINPGLDGEELVHQHLTPEQMAKCIRLLPELNEWKHQMETLYEQIGKEVDTKQRQEWAKEDAARAKRRAEYEAQVQERL